MLCTPPGLVPSECKLPSRKGRWLPVCGVELWPGSRALPVAILALHAPGDLESAHLEILEH